MQLYFFNPTKTKQKGNVEKVENILEELLTSIITLVDVAKFSRTFRFSKDCY
jgi:hypothetical protein